MKLIKNVFVVAAAMAALQAQALTVSRHGRPGVRRGRRTDDRLRQRAARQLELHRRRPVQRQPGRNHGPAAGLDGQLLVHRHQRWPGRPGHGHAGRRRQVLRLPVGLAGLVQLGLVLRRCQSAGFVRWVGRVPACQRQPVDRQVLQRLCRRWRVDQRASSSSRTATRSRPTTTPSLRFRSPRPMR